jgi:hypothetical protein
VIYNLTKYIKENIVQGYKIARALEPRLFMANTIVSIFHNCIRDHSLNLYKAIEDAKEDDEDEEEEEEENEEDDLVKLLEALLKL